ncbi:MlaE family lipid ABC transporter permease subunit [bacterium]|nr:MlaE family lipid ABC transporter permease subunit [bacterium]
MGRLKEAFAVDLIEESNGRVELQLAGDVRIQHVEAIRRAILEQIESLSGSTIILHLSRVDSFDASGAAMIAGFKRDLPEVDKELEIGEVNDAVRPLLDLSNFESLLEQPEPKTWRHRSALEHVGEWGIERGGDASSLLNYVGRVVLSLLWALTHPHKIRWGQVYDLMLSTGANALPIVGLISFLVGLVIAFVSAIQLRQFGANIFIADLIGLAVFREMGPLMAAIMLTARSGSAFAAEIGTMKVSEEVDALTVMGIKPLDYLVIPRLIAVMHTLPLLSLFADFFGILGGLVVASMSLDVSPQAFFMQMQGSIELWDVFSGILKSFVFGILIAAAGCYHGMNTTGGALGVGRSTTKSVVAGVFLIVVADSIFVVLFHYLGLN